MSTHSLVRSLAITAAAACVWAAGAVAAAQPAYVPIEERISAEQRQAAGLHKLSADELAALNALLRGERSAAVATAATDPAAGRKAPPREAIAGRLKGSFSGWTPGTRLELQDGQVWHVIEGSLYTKRVDSPAVRIEPGLVGGWYLKVDGQTSRAKVRPVK
jgi:hypothetical protein